MDLSAVAFSFAVWYNGVNENYPWRWRMELGEKLKQVRLEAGLSQRQLCGDTITRNMLSQIENGSARPSMDTLQILARRLGKPVSFFLEEQAVLLPNRTVMEQAREAAVKYPESLMNELSGQQVDKIDGRIIFEAEKRGDEAAKMVVDNYEEDLSIGITNFINVFRPEVIILGGGVSAQEEYLTDALQRKVDAMVYAGTIGEIPRIVTSKLKNDAGIIGAAVCFFSSGNLTKTIQQQSESINAEYMQKARDGHKQIDTIMAEWSYARGVVAKFESGGIPNVVA